MDAHMLSNILLELRSASIEMRQNPTEENVKGIMNKYDMLFLGKDFNCIYSNELAHYIVTFFSISVELDELNKLIPIVCDSLNMKFERMVKLDDVSKPNPQLHCYQIVL